MKDFNYWYKKLVLPRTCLSRDDVMELRLNVGSSSELPWRSVLKHSTREIIRGYILERMLEITKNPNLFDEDEQRSN